MSQATTHRKTSTVLLGLLVLAAVGGDGLVGAEEEFSLWKVDDFKPSPAVAVPLHPSPTRPTISLDGMWQVRTDPDERGFKQKWFTQPELEFPDRLTVPGNWNAQGLGGPGIPHDEDWEMEGAGMRSATLKGSYVGLVWYRKSVEIPADWQGRPIRIVFGAVLSSVRLWVDGRFVDGRWTDGNSFYFDLTDHVQPGRGNTLVMAIDSRRKETATISHLQWYVSTGGPYHHVVVRALPECHIQSALVRPSLHGAEGSGTAEVHLRLANSSDSPCDATLQLAIAPCQGAPHQFQGSVKVNVAARQTKEVVIPIKIAPVEPWSWEHPNLYKLSVRLRAEGVEDAVTERFGMRTVASVGNRFELNEKPIFILGQHFNFFWPNRLMPPITKEEYLQYLGLIKAYGFNYLRTPWLMPEECYQAADELGMMLQLEFPYAFDPYNKIKRQLIKRLIEECLVAYGNHPSLVLLCMSNEHSWDGMGELDPELCAFAKSLDPTRLVMTTDGDQEANPDVMVSEIVSLSYVTGVWEEYMKNIAQQLDIYHKRPCIDHEFLNVPSLYNPSVVDCYRGAVLAPPQALVPRLEKHIRSEGIQKEYPLYLKASHHHQANFIKEGMERSRKHPQKAGYSMCAWNDIEKDIYWGILDAFINPKGITAQQMRVYNAQSVLLVDFLDPATGQIQLLPDYCRPYGKKFAVQPLVSYFGHEPVDDATFVWSVETVSGETLATGRLANLSLASYTVSTLPQVMIGPIVGTEPQQVELTVQLSSPEIQLQNSWPLWFFPAVKGRAIGRTVFASDKVRSKLEHVVRGGQPPGADEDPSALWVTDEGELVSKWLKEGKNVLFLLDEGGAGSHPFDPGWFTGHHMGSIIRSDPLLGDFPHQGFSSWQFRNLINRPKNPYQQDQQPGRSIVSSLFCAPWPGLQHQLFAARTSQKGHLTYCLLKVLTGRCEADYLLFQLLKNAGYREANPIVELQKLDRLLGHFEKRLVVDRIVFQDDFDGVRKEGWTLQENSASEGSFDLKAKPGWLRIHSGQQNEYAHLDRSQSSSIMRDLLPGSYRLRARFNSPSPLGTFQGAAVRLIGADSWWLDVRWFSRGSKMVVGISKMENGVRTFWGDYPAGTALSVEIAVVLQKDELDIYYTSEKGKWISPSKQSFHLPSPAKQVGVAVYGDLKPTTIDTDCFEIGVPRPENR